jgi:hypothetical protein
VVLLLVKAYGLAVLYVLFLKTPARSRIEESFLSVEQGQERRERVDAIERSFWQRLGPFDGQWYLDIARNGYRRLGTSGGTPTRLPEGNYAFFPLLPTLLRGLGTIAPGGVEMLAAFSLALAGALGAWVAWLLARELGLRPWTATALLLAYPAAAFGFVLYTEALFLALSALALRSALRRDRAACALLGALCGLCRPQGVLLALPFAWELVRSAWKGREGPRGLLTSLAVTATPLSGFAAMAMVSWNVAGSPSAFLSVQSAWGRSLGGGRLLDALRDIPGYTGPPLDLLGLALGLGLLPVLWRRLPRSLALYGLGAVLLPLATGSILSLGRFLSVSVPHFLALGSLLEARPRCFAATVLVFVVLQVLVAKGLTGWNFVG